MEQKRYGGSVLCMDNVARILHEAFYCERRKHGIFGLIFEIWTSMYFRIVGWVEPERPKPNLQML